MMDKSENPPGWTLDSLERYLSGKIKTIETRFIESDQRNLERFAAKQAVAEATQIAVERTLSKIETANFLPRTEYDIQHRALVEQSRAINERLIGLEAAIAAKKEGLGLTGAIVIGGVAVLSSVIGIFTLIVHIFQTK